MAGRNPVDEDTEKQIREEALEDHVSSSQARAEECPDPGEHSMGAAPDRSVSNMFLHRIAETEGRDPILQRIEGWRACPEGTTDAKPNIRLEMRWLAE